MASLTSRKLNLLENAPLPVNELRDSRFYYREVVTPIVDKMIASFTAGLEVMNLELDWTLPIDEAVWLEEWKSIGAFFTVDVSVDREEAEPGHPGWNVKGYSGWGHSGANIEIEITLSHEYDLARRCSELRGEFLNVVAHEIHHLTQYSAPFQRPDCLPFVEKRGLQTHFEYFTSRSEAPAFVIGFRAQSDYTGRSIAQLMDEYLVSQLSAGVISSQEKRKILSEWIEHDEWRY